MIELEHIAKSIESKILEMQKSATPFNAGRVLTVNDGVTRIKGLKNAKYGELLRVGNSFALVMNLEEDNVGAVLLTNVDEVSSGDTAYLTDKVMDIGVSDKILGRVVNALGSPIDNKGSIKCDTYRPIEFPAPEIMKRGAVNTPLQTGIKAIDAMVPIGKGQRELIIGDRQTGKTTIVIDTILNQKDKDVICVYCAIGQKASSTASVISTFEKYGAMDYTVIVAATASDSASMQYLAPYTATAIAEYFMYAGKNVLICYDDLTKHAVAYRSLSLLLNRPSGREAYPGDIFYTHSRLLERSAKLCKESGGGSITALPIIETQLGDISQYIPTNVISITDGQIFLTSELFNSGIRPAVNVGLSVSRVGGSAQVKAMKKLSARLRLDLAHYRELAVFSQFASELDSETRVILNAGGRLTESLKQIQYSPINIENQIVFLFLIINNLIPSVPLQKLNIAESKFIDLLNVSAPEVLEDIRKSGDFSEENQNKVREIAATLQV